MRVIDNNEQALEALQSVCDLVTTALEIIREVQHYENVGSSVPATEIAQDCLQAARTALMEEYSRRRSGVN